MRVVVTGAGGFVGNELCKKLLANPSLMGLSISSLVLVDFKALPSLQANWVQWIEGDISTACVLDAIFANKVDIIFHLASMPGSLAEQEYLGGLQANLLTPVEIGNRLVSNGKKYNIIPTMVFTSTIAVYGTLPQHSIDDSVPVLPQISYGTHKLMCEHFYYDLSRRGGIKVQTVRLPGIVARPALGAGFGSAFMSLIFSKSKNKENYECPVGSQSTAWWMSVKCCVDNLIHASGLAFDAKSPMSWQLPTLHLSVQEVIWQINAQLGIQDNLITFQSNEALEKLFGQYPPMNTQKSLQAGFSSDNNAQELVQNVLQSL